MQAYLIAGRAGVGKSTLGRALAVATGAVLLDLDTVTNGLLDQVFPATGLPGHWNDDRHRGWIRPARYAALIDVAAEQLQLGREVVLAAPFSRELGGGRDWDALNNALSPAALLVAWLHAPDEVRSRRVRDRGELRDSAVVGVRAAVTPGVPHLAVDATWATGDQVVAVMQASTSGG